MSGSARGGAMVAVAALLAAGCLGTPAGPGGAPAFVPCEHPWPCADGSEWPRDLRGPFALREVAKAQVASHDGTVLDGWVLFPDVPGAPRLPAVVVSTPYVGMGQPLPDDPAFEQQDEVSVRALVEAGFAVAVFSVRGSGHSGGCLDLLSPEEQGDQPVLVEWLAAQPWSNGRVGMMGLSWPSATVLEAAVANPPALKAAIVGGVIPDAYLRIVTPQGAVFALIAAHDPTFPAQVMAIPAARDGPWALQGHAAQAGGRACPGASEFSRGGLHAGASDDRDAAFWARHSVRARLPEVRAAVLDAHGFEDGLAFPDDTLWHDLARAPRRAFVGHWSHEFPDRNLNHPGWELREAWLREVVAWFDFWLKGLGTSAGAGVGRADYQDTIQQWRSAAAWPPPDAREEALFLSPGALGSEPGAGASTVRAARTPGASVPGGVGLLTGAPVPRPTTVAMALCPEGQAAGLGAAFVGEPLAAPAVLAGNPYVVLALESDQPGGVLALALFDLAPDFACRDGVPEGAQPLPLGNWADAIGGAADLRFHRGNLVGEDFPTGAPATVRVDLPNLAARLDVGHRVALAAWAPDPAGWGGLPSRFAPTLALHAQGEPPSHVVLPVVEGTLGGAAPPAGAPPRPFGVAADAR